MTTPTRGLLFHMTSIDNLPSIISHGMLSDDRVRSKGLLETEIGEDRIKGTRRRLPVRVAPGGTVSSYVPFYFAARSPMLLYIKSGNVPAYQEGQEPIIYLVTDAGSLATLGCESVFTDRNASLAFARHESDLALINAVIDWPLMEATYWAGDDDRKERRMAEFLVRDHVSFGAITQIGVRSDGMAARVREILGTMDPHPQVSVRPEWYY
jgi:ssDNA thymidine ADP-ribosyltransferase, DarT